MKDGPASRRADLLLHKKRHQIVTAPNNVKILSIFGKQPGPAICFILLTERSVLHATNFFQARLESWCSHKTRCSCSQPFMLRSNNITKCPELGNCLFEGKTLTRLESNRQKMMKSPSHVQWNAGSMRFFAVVHKEAELFCGSFLRKGEVLAYDDLSNQPAA